MAQAHNFQEEQQEVMSSNDHVYEAWFRRKVERSLIAANAGQLLSCQDVDKRAEARIREALEKRGALD